MIPITVVEFGADVEQSVLECLRSGMIAQGPRVAQFEECFAQMTGTKHAVAMSSGTVTLVAALQALDLGPGDEVVTSPFTFIATLNSILEAGATARFADVDEADFCVTAATLAERLSDRTKVLMPVHLYGQAADMGPIAALAGNRGLAIVEDAAQAHGATVDGRGVGTYGLGSFSFYATKNITSGEGGMVTTDDDALAEKLRLLRNQGMAGRYQYVLAGHNYRMTDLQASVALPQLDRYDEVVATRAANAARLSEGLAGVRGIVTPRELPGRRHVWHQYTIRVTPEAGVARDEVVSRLQAEGVGCGIYYPQLVTAYEAYRHRPDVVLDECPVAERLAAEVLSLPVHTHLSAADIDRIVEAVTKAVAA